MLTVVMFMVAKDSQHCTRFKHEFRGLLVHLLSAFPPAARGAARHPSSGAGLPPIEAGTMADNAAKKLADLAISILSEHSPEVEAFSADGGVLKLTVQGQRGAYIAALAPKLHVRAGLQLLARAGDPQGAGHDIELAVAEIHSANESTVAVDLRVLDVRRRDSHRMTPRAQLADLALVHVLGARAIAPADEFDVRLADLSTNGVAFVTDRSFYSGDLVAMMITVSGGVLRLRGRVLQTTASHYGRQRVGCEITQVSENDRRRIAALTDERPAGGDPGHRLRRSA
jgi:PilZ domain